MVAIEIKASIHPNDKHLAKRRRVYQRFIVVSQAPETRILEDNIEILPWKVFLAELWPDRIIES